MRRIVPSWGKTAMVAAGLLLLAVLVYRAGGPKPEASPEGSNPAQRADPLIPGDTAPSIQAQEAPTILHPPAEANSIGPSTTPPAGANASLDERRRMLNERRDLAQQLMTQSPGDLVNRLGALWASADQSGRQEEKSLVIGALTAVLRGDDKQSNDAAFQQLGTWLRDTSLPSSTRNEIASILGGVQTPQSVQLLLAEYQQASDEKTQEVLAKEIAKTGDERWAARFHEDLSPALEAVWPTAKGDPNLAQAVALALAKVGSPSGVKLLIADAAGPATSVEALSDIKDPSARAAASSLQAVRNPSAVPVLAAGLLGPEAPIVQQYICGSTLAAMGNADATRTLLKWASTAPDTEVPWAATWFDKLRDTASFQLVEAATSTTAQVQFSSAAVRNAVALGLRNR